MGKKSGHGKNGVREVLRQLCEYGGGRVRMTYMGPDKKRHNYEGPVTALNSRKVEVPVYGMRQLMSIRKNDILRIQLLSLQNDGGDATLY